MRALPAPRAPSTNFDREFRDPLGLSAVPFRTALSRPITAANRLNNVHLGRGRFGFPLGLSWSLGGLGNLSLVPAFGCRKQKNMLPSSATGGKTWSKSEKKMSSACLEG